MPKSVPVSEAKSRLGSIVDWVAENQDVVIIQSQGHPKAVILPYAEYERFVALREFVRREEALWRLESLVEKVQAQNDDLSQEEAGALADRLTREAIEAMAQGGSAR